MKTTAKPTDSIRIYLQEIGRYPLLDDTPLPWSKVGDRMGLSRERVRQVGNLALNRLRRQVKGGG